MKKAPKAIDSAVYRQRMKVAFDLFETGQRIMRQNLRRRNPDLDEAAIEKLLIEWRHHRPGAEHGDGVGRPVPKEEVDAWLASKES